MKNGLHYLAVGSLVGGMLVATVALATDAPPPIKKRPSPGPKIQQSLFVKLECKNPGSHQDVAKTPWVKNTTAKTMPKGHKINWKASDGDKGVITLTKDLPAGQ